MAKGKGIQAAGDDLCRAADQGGAEPGAAQLGRRTAGDVDGLGADRGAGQAVMKVIIPQRLDPSLFERLNRAQRQVAE